MNFFFLSVFGVFLFANSCAAAADSGQAVKPGATTASDANATAEFDKIEAADDAAQAEVDKWTRENSALKAKGGGVSDAELERRIGERFEPIRKTYDDFVHRHPEDARARLGYGNFLNDRQDELGAQAQWERALELDPNNPTIYNNLAGRYSESGPVNKAFDYFRKAITLSPGEAAYYHNFGDSLYVQRRRAAIYYAITEQAVYGRVLLLYSNALRLAPQKFVFARDLAQTYYSLKPLPFEAALGAWTNALAIAREEADREDVEVHLARVKMLAGRLAEARTQLAGVTNEACAKAKSTLLHNLEERERGAATNGVPTGD